MILKDTAFLINLSNRFIKQIKIKKYYKATKHSQINLTLKE